MANSTTRDHRLSIRQILTSQIAYYLTSIKLPFSQTKKAFMSERFVVDRIKVSTKLLLIKLITEQIQFVILNLKVGLMYNGLVQL